MNITITAAADVAATVNAEFPGAPAEVQDAIDTLIADVESVAWMVASGKRDETTVTSDYLDITVTVTR